MIYSQAAIKTRAEKSKCTSKRKNELKQFIDNFRLSLVSFPVSIQSKEKVFIQAKVSQQQYQNSKID